MLIHADPIARCDTTGEAKRQDWETCNFVAHSLRGEGFDASEDGTGRGTPLVPVGFNARQDPDHWNDRTGPLDTDGGTQAVAFSCKDYGGDAGAISPTLRAMGYGESHANAGGQVAVAIQPMTFDWQAGGGGADTSFRGKSRSYITDKPGRARALTACKTLAVATTMQVRRLTPTECARLQGFPDDYLDILYRGKPAADGPKYKALGNSWAVPCVTWLGRRIAASLE